MDITLFSTDGLAKLAKTVGGWFGLEALATIINTKAEGFAMKSKAKAENETALIRLQGEEQLANYILSREKRKMDNVKSVVQLAQTQFANDEEVSKEQVNQDWVNRFFSIVEEVSDFEMQKLWSQILAGEVKRPKSYSLRTLEVLRNMTKEEADLFVKATSYMIDNDSIINEINCSLSVEELLTLSDIGLVNNEDLTVTYTLNKQSSLSHIKIDKLFGVGIYNPDVPIIRLELSVRSLTIVGKELVKLIDYTTSDVVYRCIVEKCKKLRCKAVVKSPITGHLPDGQCLYSKQGELLYKQEE